MDNYGNTSVPNIDTSFSNMSLKSTILHSQMSRQSNTTSSPTHKQPQNNIFYQQQQQQQKSAYYGANTTMGSDYMDTTVESVLNTSTGIPANNSYWNHRNITAPIVSSANPVVSNPKNSGTVGSNRVVSTQYGDYSLLNNTSMNNTSMNNHNTSNVNANFGSYSNNDMHMLQTNTDEQDYRTNAYRFDNVKENYRNSNANKISHSNNDTQSMEMQLKIKDTQIESLEQEIQNLKKFLQKRNLPKSALPTAMNPMTSPTAVSGANGIVDYKKNADSFPKNEEECNAVYQKMDDEEKYVFPVLPKNLETIVNKLTKSLESKTAELEETKDRLETLVTAIIMNPSPSTTESSISNVSTKYGRYDVEAVAHKMVVRLELLTQENQQMAKMLSFGRSKEYQIELQLLKKQNAQLQETVVEQHEKLHSLNRD